MCYKNIFLILVFTQSSAVCNRARRTARALALTKALARNDGVSFVDAAEYPHGTRFAAVTTREGSLHHGISLVTPHAEEAEEVAIALATLDPTFHTIVSDSRSAVINYINGRISHQALRIFQQALRSTYHQVTLVWFPAHVGTVHPHLRNLNEVTHSLVRVLVNGAGDAEAAPTSRYRLTRCNDVMKSFYLELEAKHFDIITCLVGKID